MFSLSPFDMMMYQPSSVYHQRPVYVQSPYQRYVRPSHQHVYVEDAEDELAEYVARVRAAEQARVDAERQLAYQQQQLAQAKQIAYLRAVEQERKQREAEQVAYYQAVQAERQRRQKLYDQQVKLRDAKLKRRCEEQQLQRQLQQVEKEKTHEQDEQLKHDLLSQLFGEVLGQHLSRHIKRQSVNNKQEVKPVQPAKPSSIQQQQQPAKQSVTSPSKTDAEAESPFFIPVRVINSSEPSHKQTNQSSVPSRVSVPLTVNTAPSSPVEIEDEPITPEQWNLDASDVFKADRVLTPSPSEPTSPKQASASVASVKDVPAVPSVEAATQSDEQHVHTSTNDQQDKHMAADQSSVSTKEVDISLDQTIEQSNTQVIDQPSSVAEQTYQDTQADVQASTRSCAQQSLDQHKVDQSNIDCEWEKVESH